MESVKDQHLEPPYSNIVLCPECRRKVTVDELDDNGGVCEYCKDGKNNRKNKGGKRNG